MSKVYNFFVQTGLNFGNRREQSEVESYYEINKYVIDCLWEDEKGIGQPKYGPEFWQFVEKNYNVDMDK